MRAVGAIGDVLGLSVGVVVEKERPAGYAVVRPVVDAVSVVGAGADDVGGADPVIECVGGDMSELGRVLDGYGYGRSGYEGLVYMAEAIPLSPALGI